MVVFFILHLLLDRSPAVGRAEARTAFCLTVPISPVLILYYTCQQRDYNDNIPHFSHYFCLLFMSVKHHFGYYHNKTTPLYQSRLQEKVVVLE